MGCVASVPAFADDDVAANPSAPNLPPPPSSSITIRSVTEGELYSATAGFAPTRLLGEGGFGRVYQGVWADGTSVAVKVLTDSGLQGPAEFHTEIAVLTAAAGSPHVVPLLGVCAEPGGMLASVLAHAPGGSLRSALASGGGEADFPWPARLGAAAGAAAGLATIHALGWAHGDVASGNVLLAGGGQAWLSDFGLARRVVDGGSGGAAAASPRAGTPTPPRGAWPYLAPELLGGSPGPGAPPPPDGRPTQPADVWALGVVFLELLTGQQAGGQGRTLRPLPDRLRPVLEAPGGLAASPHLLDARLFAEASGDGPPAPQVAALAEAAAGCLSPDPAARPTAAAVALYLSKAAAGGGQAGGRVRRAAAVVEEVEREKAPPPPPPPPHPPRPVASLMDAVTALDDDGDRSGNPFL